MKEYGRDLSPMERIKPERILEYTLEEIEQTSNNGGNISSHAKGSWGGGGLGRYRSLAEQRWQRESHTRQGILTFLDSRRRGLIWLE